MNDNENCTANGCPMLGTVKSGTNGEGGIKRAYELKFEASDM